MPDERVTDGFWKNGRFYGSYKPGKYIFPIDKEELNRLDILHKAFFEARSGKVSCIAVDTTKKLRMLDLGTGTSIWAIDVAEQFGTETEVLGVDLNKMQPNWIPPNLKTAQFDLEEPDWTSLKGDYDLVHMRHMLGSLRDEIWPHVYRQALQQLKPGTGVLEQSEIDWVLHWSENSEFPPNDAIKKWSELFKTSMERMGRNVRIESHHAQRLLEEAGFTEFKEEKIRIFINPWPTSDAERNIGRWFNLGFTQGLEALSLESMTETSDMTIPEIKALCEAVRKESCVVRYQGWFTLHVWTARRPETTT